MKDRATKDGMHGEYRCIGVKSRGEPCSAGICIKFDKKPGDESVELYRLPNEHDHENSPNKVTRLSDDVKRIISRMVDDGKKLIPIMDFLHQQEDIEQPQKKQVENFIKTYRKIKFGEAKVTVQSFMDFARAHTDIPDDMDEAFVIGFEHSPLDGLNEKGEEVEPWIRIVISTKRLLEISAGSNIIHADGT